MTFWHSVYRPVPRNVYSFPLKVLCSVQSLGKHGSRNAFVDLYDKIRLLYDSLITWFKFTFHTQCCTTLVAQYSGEPGFDGNYRYTQFNWLEKQLNPPSIDGAGGGGKGSDHRCGTRYQWQSCERPPQIPPSHWYNQWGTYENPIIELGGEGGKSF